jgi:hypothetical protein
MAEILRQVAEKLLQLPVIMRYFQVELTKLDIGFSNLDTATLHTLVEVHQFFRGTSMNL